MEVPKNHFFLLFFAVSLSTSLLTQPSEGKTILELTKPGKTLIAQNTTLEPEISLIKPEKTLIAQIPRPEADSITLNKPGRKALIAQGTTPQAEPRVLVGEVNVVGVDGELETLIYNTIQTRPGRTTTRSQVQEDINAIYVTGFFSEVEVDVEDTPLGVRLTFIVEANPILSKVAIETVPFAEEDRALPDSLVEEIFSPQYGRILNLRELQEGIIRINEWYSENGYDLAQVVGSPQISPDGVVTLIIAEGVVEDIQVKFFDAENEPVEGKTRDFIITREIELKPGNVFNRNIAQRDLQRVFGLGLFEDIRLSFSPGSDPSQVIVNVEVVEGRTGSIAAGAGISSASGLFGTISFQQRNLGGNNQTIGAEIQVGQRELLFDVSFTDPWIATTDDRTSYTVNLFRRRSISLVYDGDNSAIRTANGDDRPRIVRTGGGINFSRPLTETPYERPVWVLSTGIQYENVRIENADGDLSPRARKQDNSINLAFSDRGVDDLILLRFSATQDLRNNPIQPTSGSIFRVGMEQSVPVGSGNILLNRVRASYSYFIPVKFLNFEFMRDKPQALAFNVQGGTVLGDLPPYEAFVLGGSNSVRGYAEGEVGSGKSYLQATIEYRFPVYAIVGGAIFFDAGTDLGTASGVPGNPSAIRDLPGSGFGYGLGIRIQSPLGPIRIDYGINNEGDGRIHFGIGERF
ncbi:MAG: hypothetical protein EA365_07630 [Gloeocapsa sp. DLM2.Bin57]|nr:MAG: hypothetical protein EA365_07630 [Gloeocapsa sp. DLM2.Bin57]